MSQAAGLTFTADVFQRLQKEGIPYTARVAAPVTTRMVRVIVYDYQADLVGSAEARVW